MENLFYIAVAPGIAFALILYLADRYDREPFDLLLKIYIFGALSVIPVAIVESLLSKVGSILSQAGVLTGYLAAAYSAFIIAGCTEEYFKRIVVVKFALFHRAFNEKLDGIIYCAFSALGFATVENVLYVVFRFSANPYVGIVRGLLSVPAHMLFGITMGYYLSLYKYSTNPREARYYLWQSLFVPIIFHGTFDFLIMSGNHLLAGLLIPFVILLWVKNLRKLKKFRDISRDESRRDDYDY